MRGGCSWTTLHKAAVLSVPTEIYDSQSSLKIWHKHSLTHLCVLVFLYSCHILSLLCPMILCSNSWKDTGIEDPFDRLHLAHFSIPKPKATGHKDRKSLSPFGHFKKKAFQKKCLFQGNFILAIAELCSSSYLSSQILQQFHWSYTISTSRVSQWAKMAR